MENIIKKIRLTLEHKKLNERVLSIDQTEHSEIKISYNSNDLQPADKRSFEDRVTEALVDIIPEQELLFSAQSNKIRPKDKESEKPHEIKVGHGLQHQKSRVPGVKNVIAVSSAKGGVGKSTISANLAIALSLAGKKVGLLDADIYGPSQVQLFGVQNRPIMSGNDQQKKMMKPIIVDGISLVSFASFIDEEQPVIWRGPMLNGVLNQFLFEVEWGELDYLVIDMPPGTGDVALSLCQNTEVDGVVIVTTPQTVSLLDVQKGVNMFHSLNTPILGVVQNMAYFICDQCEKKHTLFGPSKVEHLLDRFELPMLASLPFGPYLCDTGESGRPLMSEKKHNKDQITDLIYESFISLAQKVEEHFTSGDR